MAQSQDLIMKTERRLNAQPKEGCSTEGRTLVGKKGDPKVCGKNLWINALRNLEPQIFRIFWTWRGVPFLLVKASALCA